MYQPIDQAKTGIKLKMLLKAAGYDVKYIQEYLHLSCPQSIYRWFKGKVLPSVEHLCALSNGAGLQISHEGIVVNLLEKLMRDKGSDLSYFIYELDYGKDYHEGCISDENGNIDFSTPEKLYDYLVKGYLKQTVDKEEK